MRNVAWEQPLLPHRFLMIESAFGAAGVDLKYQFLPVLEAASTIAVEVCA